MWFANHICFSICWSCYCLDPRHCQSHAWSLRTPDNHLSVTPMTSLSITYQRAVSYFNLQRSEQVTLCLQCPALQHTFPSCPGTQACKVQPTAFQSIINEFQTWKHTACSYDVRQAVQWVAAKRRPQS